MKSEYESILTANLSPEHSSWLLRSLKDLSYDSTQRSTTANLPVWDESHPTLSACKAISFDNIAALHSEQLHIRRSRSCDALYISTPVNSEGVPESYWIEFKNGEIKERQVQECVDKFKEGFFILSDLGAIDNGKLNLANYAFPCLISCSESENFAIKVRLASLGIPFDQLAAYVRQHFHFILVYNEERKEKLLVSDIDSIIDEIHKGNDGEYQYLISQTERIKSNPICKHWFDQAEPTNDDITGQQLLERVFGRMRDSSQPRKWFEIVCSAIETMKAICDGNFSEICGYWDSLTTDEKKLFIIQKIKCLYEGQSRRQRQRPIAISAAKIGNNLGDLSVTQGTDFLLSIICSQELNRCSIELFDYIVPLLRIASRLHKLEHGGYNAYIQLLCDNPFLISLDFDECNLSQRELAFNYLRHLIENDKLDQEQMYWNTGRRISDYFLSCTASRTIWPKSFFRFGIYEGQYYKTATTYSREEFQREFVEGVCRDICHDPNA